MCFLYFPEVLQCSFFFIFRATPHTNGTGASCAGLLLSAPRRSSLLLHYLSASLAQALEKFLGDLFRLLGAKQRADPLLHGHPLNCWSPCVKIGEVHGPELPPDPVPELLDGVEVRRLRGDLQTCLQPFEPRCLQKGDEMVVDEDDTMLAFRVVLLPGFPSKPPVKI